MKHTHFDVFEIGRGSWFACRVWREVRLREGGRGTMFVERNKKKSCVPHQPALIAKSARRGYSCLRHEVRTRDCQFTCWNQECNELGTLVVKRQSTSPNLFVYWALYEAVTEIKQRWPISTTSCCYLAPAWSSMKCVLCNHLAGYPFGPSIF